MHGAMKVKLIMDCIQWQASALNILVMLPEC